MPRVCPCKPLCALLRGWVESQPLQGFLRRFSGAFYGSSEDESLSGIKNRRQVWRSVRLLLPAVRAVTGVFGEFQSGVKIEGVISLLRSLSPRAYSRKKKVGVMAWKRCYRKQKGHLLLCRMPEREMPFLQTNTLKNCVAKQRISLGSVQTVIDNNLITLLGWDGY